MRVIGLILIFAVLLCASGYWYSVSSDPCKTPIHYSIGTIDTRFHTSTTTLMRVAQKAESVWEDATHSELFVYDPNASLHINMIFDERQAQAEKEIHLRENLKQKEGMSESVGKQYELLIQKFNALKKTYESQVTSYEGKLQSYNSTVTDWNTKGGVPPSEVAKLERTQQDLVSLKQSLEIRAKELNALATQLNTLGARGNSLIADYNTTVNTYNSEFNEASEFTQGEYTGKTINIYQFDSEDDLVLVLAHEFGHALSLKHVPNKKSVMYYEMKEQTLTQGLSSEDLSAYNTVCSHTVSFMNVGYITSAWMFVRTHFGL